MNNKYFETAIIVPAYNCSKTLERLLDSIAIQDYEREKFCVYIINDKSPEGSYEEIIKPYASCFNVVEIVLQENLGAGGARQAGTDYTNSKYITYADADDEYMGSKALSSLVSTANEKKLDIARGLIYSERKHDIVDDPDVHLHGKLYRRKYLKDNEICFCMDRRATCANEDVAFNLLCNFYMPKDELVKYPTYFWHDDPNSLTHDANWEKKNIIGGIINRTFAYWKMSCSNYPDLAREEYVKMLIAYYGYCNDHSQKKNLEIDFLLEWIKKFVEETKQYYEGVNQKELEDYVNEVYKSVELEYLPKITFDSYCKYIFNERGDS